MKVNTVKEFEQQQVNCENVSITDIRQAISNYSSCQLSRGEYDTHTFLCYAFDRQGLLKTCHPAQQSKRYC